MLQSLQHSSQLATAVSTGSQQITPELTFAADAELYNVRIITGRRRGAETSDGVSIQLIGANGSTEKHHLRTEDGFPRGSTKDFSIPVPKGLGDIKRLHLEKDASPEFDRGGGW